MIEQEASPKDVFIIRSK